MRYDCRRKSISAADITICDICGTKYHKMVNYTYINGNVNGIIGPMPNGCDCSFESRLAVMRVRSNFIAPYRKCAFIYIERKDVTSHIIFKKRLHEIASSWPPGTYYLKMSSGRVFCRFDLKNGRVSQIHKDSPSTKKTYPIWEVFSK